MRRKINFRITMINYLKHIYFVSSWSPYKLIWIRSSKIIHLQNLLNQLPNAFINTKKVIKSHISIAITLAWIDVHVVHLTNESKIRLKCGLISWNDVIPWKKKKTRKIDTLKKAINMMDQFKINEPVTPEEVQIKHTVSKKTYWI